MIEESNIRFSGADWFSADNPETVVVGGAGGIGSWLCLALARANFKVICFDDDKIEPHNTGGQFYKTIQERQYKVVALHENIKLFTTNLIEGRLERITLLTPTHEFMMGGFDNMQARKDMFNVWKKSWNEMNSPILIDGRLNMEGFQIFCVTPKTADKYEQEYLFDDKEADDGVCSLKQTSHTAMMIAGFMTAFFTNHIANIKLREVVREIPFMYEYFIPANLTVNENG